MQATCEHHDTSSSPAKNIICGTLLPLALFVERRKLSILPPPYIFYGVVTSSTAKLSYFFRHSRFLYTHIYTSKWDSYHDQITNKFNHGKKSVNSYKYVQSYSCLTLAINNSHILFAQNSFRSDLKGHSSLLCAEDCSRLVTSCVDWSRTPPYLTARSLCGRLAPRNNEAPCVQLRDFMAPSELDHRQSIPSW